MAGPFGEQDEAGYRGLGIYRRPIEEVRRLIQDDPMIRARRLEGVLVDWYIAAGSVAFPLDSGSSGAVAERTPEPGR